MVYTQKRINNYNVEFVSNQKNILNAVLENQHREIF